MICMRCAVETPRLTLMQRYCPPCQRDVERLVEQDAKRRAPRFPVKDLSGQIGITL